MKYKIFIGLWVVSACGNPETNQDQQKKKKKKVLFDK